MHLVEALIEAVTGNNWHNCSWNGRTGRFCQENGPSTCATYSGDRTSEVYFAGMVMLMLMMFLLVMVIFFLMIMDLVLKISAFCNVLEKFLTKIARDFW